MARRNGKRGQYLGSDDYTGFTEYANRLKEDYWGNRVRKPLERNLQEIASPLLDPYPVPFFSGSTYEVVNPCDAETAPLFIGRTNVRTPTNSSTISALGLNPALGEMQIGCTFRVS